MGKKPVIGLAGLFLASAVLCGCQRNQACNSGVCGSNGHLAAGQGWNTGQKGAVGQPGGAVAGGSATTPGMTGTGTTPGFTTVGNSGMSGGMTGSSTSTVPPASGLSGTRAIGGHGGAMGSPSGSMGGSSGLSGTRTIPSTGLNSSGMSGGQSIVAPSAPVQSGIPGGSSGTTTPRTMTVPGGATTLPDNPAPLDGTSSQSNHSGAALTPATGIAPPNDLGAMPAPVQTLPDPK